MVTHVAGNAGGPPPPSEREVRLEAELRAAEEVIQQSPTSERLRLLADWLDLHDNNRQYRGPREVQDDLRRFAEALDAYGEVGR